MVGIELVKYTLCVEALGIIRSDHFPVKVKLKLITGIVGKTNVVKKSNDDLEKKWLLLEAFKDRVEWSGAGAVGKWTFKAWGDWKAWNYVQIIRGCLYDSEWIGPIIYNCAQKSERLNKKNKCKFLWQWV